jgi:hypothetical protein
MASALDPNPDTLPDADEELRRENRMYSQGLADSQSEESDLRRAMPL